MRKIGMTRLLRTGNFVLAFLLVSIFASQCFAQSPAQSSKNSARESRQYMEMMNGIFDFVQKNYVDEVDPAVLYRGALKGMLESLEDPYTLYLDTSTMRSLSDTTEGKFGGVGLSISKPYESTPDKPAYVEVASPIEDTPGFRAGIVAGDLIISVDGTDTSEITMEEVLGKLRGKVGESVDLVIRRGKAMEFPVSLIRDYIEVPTVKYGTIASPTNAGRLHEQPVLYGYIRIIEFTPLTAERVQEALDSFGKTISALIIDVRNNPGGLITSVADVADKFIDSGPIVTTKSRIAYENSVFTASPKKTTFKGLPIIVLINKGSASASEILAGALKDNHLAYLVGQRTYGKGSVQQVMPLSATDGIKMTMARYYTPSDTNIDKIGIPPDREVLYPDLGEEGEKEFADLLKNDDIAKYVDAHAAMSEADIAAFAKRLAKKYPHIDERTLRKLTRNQVDRTKPAALYDLDYDIQLGAALDILGKESFTTLVRATKTLKELQEEAEAQKAAEEKPAKK